MSPLPTSAGSFSVPHDHPCLPGHFPGQPIVPGALLIDLALDLIAAGGQAGTYPQGIAVKFFLPVLPGENVELRCGGAGAGELGFEAYVSARLVFSGRLTVASGASAP